MVYSNGISMAYRSQVMSQYEIWKRLKELQLPNQNDLPQQPSFKTSLLGRMSQQLPCCLIEWAYLELTHWPSRVKALLKQAFSGKPRMVTVLISLVRELHSTWTTAPQLAWVWHNSSLLCYKYWVYFCFVFFFGTFWSPHLSWK